MERKVEIMTKALLEWETLDSEQVDDIMAGRDPRPPKPTGSASAGSGMPPTAGATTITPPTPAAGADDSAESAA